MIVCATCWTPLPVGTWMKMHGAEVSLGSFGSCEGFGRCTRLSSQRRPSSPKLCSATVRSTQGAISSNRRRGAASRIRLALLAVLDQVQQLEHVVEAQSDVSPSVPGWRDLLGHDAVLTQFLTELLGLQPHDPVALGVLDAILTEVVDHLLDERLRHVAGDLELQEVDLRHPPGETLLIGPVSCLGGVPRGTRDLVLWHYSLLQCGSVVLCSHTVDAVPALVMITGRVLASYSNRRAR